MPLKCNASSQTKLVILSRERSCEGHFGFFFGYIDHVGSCCNLCIREVLSSKVDGGLLSKGLRLNFGLNT